MFCFPSTIEVNASPTNSLCLFRLQIERIDGVVNVKMWTNLQFTDVSTFRLPEIQLNQLTSIEFECKPHDCRCRGHDFTSTFSAKNPKPNSICVHSTSLWLTLCTLHCHRLPHHFEPRRIPCAMRCDTILHVQVHSRILSRTKPSTNLLLRFTSIHTKSERRWRRRGQKSRSDHPMTIQSHWSAFSRDNVFAYRRKCCHLLFGRFVFALAFSSRLIWHKCKRIVVVAHICRYSTAAFLRMQSKWKHCFLAEIVESQIVSAVHRRQNLVNDKRPKCTQSNNRKYIISRCFGQQRHDREQKIKKQKKNGRGEIRKRCCYVVDVVD